MSEMWDTEQVLAFVYEVRSWRDLDDDERAEWCQRVKWVRSNVTTDGQKWTTKRLAGLFGIMPESLNSRFSRSASQNGGASATVEANREASIRSARSAIRKRPELAASLLVDPGVKSAIATAIAADAASTALVASMVEDKRPKTKSSAGTDRGLVGVTGLAVLLDELDNGVLVIEERLPEFTAALREGTVPNGDAIAEEWHDKLTIAAQMLELATIETI